MSPTSCQTAPPRVRRAQNYSFRREAMSNIIRVPREGNRPMAPTPATKLAIHRLLADAYRSTVAPDALEIAVPRHRDADEYAILPPYLGEFGFEVRVFLGAVEPWLHNGWSIPARRPELYPPGTAFADPEFFAEID